MTSYNLSGTPKPDSEIVHLKNGKTRVTKPKTARPKIPELIKSKDESELKGTKFQWKIKKLQSMKNKLNKIKSPLDIINSNKKGRYAYRMIVRESGYYEDIRGADGLIVEEYGAEVVTNAWLKFWEILHVYFRDYLDDKDKHHPEFNTFHVAEAPGNFILCLNHFISKNNLDAVVCIAAALRRGILNQDEASRYEKPGHNLAEGYDLSGLGQLIEAASVSDRIVSFGE